MPDSKCPKCGGNLKEYGNALKCERCGNVIYNETPEDYSPKQAGYRELLRDFKSGTFKSYHPVVDFEHGIHYPEAEASMKGNRASTESFLSSLEKVGVIIPEIWDNIVVCPKCGTHKLFIQLRCPSCGSGKLQRRSLIQHFSCGHFDTEEAFVKGDKYVCPKCNKVLNALGVDYRRAGKVYKCLNCGLETPIPKFKYMCINGHEFYDDEFTLKELKLYRVDPSKKSEVEKLIDILPLLNVLSKHGMYVEAPVSIIGISGIKFNFSFAAWVSEAEKSEGKGPFVLGEVLVSDRTIDVEPILMFKAKSEEVNYKYAVIIAVPGLSEEAREFARSCGFSVLEVENLEMLEQKVDEFLEGVISVMKRRESGETRTEESEKS